MVFALVASLLAAAPVVSTASANVPVAAKPMPGLNVSGCEFADSAALCPTAATIDAYADMGFKAVRIPVRSRQLAAAIPKLKPTVAQALKRNMVTVIDLHDYLALDPARITPLIVQLATAFGPNVWIDYDNEPKGPTGATGDAWVAAATAVNTIVAGARAAGVTNVLVAEWPSFSGNHRFPSTEAANAVCGSFACGLDRVGGLKDPLGKTVLGPHRYYDADKSGTAPLCPTTGWYWSTYLQAAEARNYKTFVGETAFGNANTGVPASCTLAGQKIMGEISASKSIVAYTVWGGGGAWNAGYLFAVPPTATAAASPYVWQITAQ